VLGRFTPGSRLPAVTLGNLAGGTAMLALFGWLWCRARGPARSVQAGASPRAPGARLPRGLAAAAAALLALQIALGALLGANLGGRACASLMDCREAWWPWRWELAAFDLWREPALPALPDAARRTLAMAHRWGAALAAAACGAVAFALARAGEGERALALAGLLAAQLGAGLALAWLDLPLAAALAHNALAALLVLALAAALAAGASPHTRSG
jgi:cytochrome c oxidase assembly protein subunit 15